MANDTGSRARPTGTVPTGDDLRRSVQAALTDEHVDGRDVDVAVVGGGVSGLYTAHRLVADDATPFGGDDVEVFEKSGRIGGRLASTRLPGLESAGELGGMRFKPETHRIVNALATDVFADRLDVAEFPMGEPEHHLRYLRGQRFRADAWTDAQERGEEFETRYFLDGEHAGFSPGQLFRKVIHEVLDADPWVRERYGEKLSLTGEYEYEVSLTREEWDDVKRNVTYEFEGPYEGLPLADMGMWAVLEDRIGMEGYEFLTDAEGYYALTANWNAAQAMADIALDFATVPDFKTLAGGFDLLAYALADAVTNHSVVRTRNALRTFTRTPNGARRYELTMEHEPDGTEWSVTADHVVLAMPRRSLELLDQYNFFFDDETLQRNVRSVLNQPALKILMAFEEPWWTREFGAEHGASVTDLPIRQCYYFGTNAGDDDRSLLLASYNDERAVSFWSDLADERRRDETREEDAFEVGTDAPERMVEEATRQLRDLHGVGVPEPYAVSFADWSRDPYGGGYNHWKTDVPIWDLMPEMRRPYADEQVYVVGSAYSGRQGWVEGALCTAEKTVESQFGATHPGWLDDDYYLGW